MNTKLFIGGIVVLLAISFVVLRPPQPTNKNSIEQKSEGAMEKKNDTIPSDTGEMMKKESRYVAYSKSAFDAATIKKRVYFFHATWCSTCKTADTQFTDNYNSIPEDIVLFKTDYDTEKELKKQYAITYQHTFVLVDAAGKEMKKWNGGGIVELIQNTK